MKKILLLILIMCFQVGFAKEPIEVIHNQAGIYIFKINTKKLSSKIKPYIAKKLTTPQKVYEENNFELVVNGGFYDTRTGISVSDVVIDNKQVASLDENYNLVENLKKEKKYEKIASRAEFRILENKNGKIKFDIARHDKPIKKRYKLKHSLQAGPMLHPNMDLAGEGFVVYENEVVKSQSVDILKRRERTALGLKGKYLYIVLFTKEYKLAAFELRDFFEKELKIKKAMMLDGGLSTAISYKNYQIGSLGKHQRKVKSFLVVER